MLRHFSFRTTRTTRLTMLRMATLVLAASVIASLAFALVPTQSAYAASTINVNTTADENGTGTACSLREAITTANNNANFGGCTGASGSPFTINLPAGTYNLSVGALSVGTLANTTIDIVGAGAASTTINQTLAGHLVFNVNPSVVANVVFDLSGVTVTGGNENENDPDGFGGNGGAILAGGSASAPGNAVSITNVTFSGNYCSPVTNAGCSGGAISMTGGGNLTVSGSTFTGNVASKNRGFGAGGAIYFDNGGNGGNVSITGSTFTNNVAQGNSTTGGQGGAVRLAGGAGSIYTVNTNTFTGNAANGTLASGTHGGALYLSLGSLTASFNRIVGNTSGGDASGLYVANNNGSIGTATDNWWGCNSGPSAGPCDTAVLGTPNQGGSMTVSPWIVLTNTASPNPIKVNQTTTLTADFLHNSTGGSLTTSQISVLLGLPVTWGNAVRGALSGSQATIQSNGTATSTFTASAAGAGSGDATVDHATATGSVTINKADTTTTITSDSPDPTVTGQSYTVNFTMTSNTGSTPTAPTGTVTVSDGTDSCSGTIASGTCTITSTTAGSKTLTATYGGDSNFNTSTSAGVAHTVNKANTTTAVGTVSPEPSVVGQSVTINYSVAVNSPGGGTPTGNVTVSDSTVSCTGTVAAGQCSIAFTSAGFKTLTATYAGDANYNGSTSTSSSHTVNKADTTTTITSDNPDPSNPGQAVTVNFTVAPVAPGAGTATGNVTVTDGVDSCTGTVSAGTCSITLNTTGARTLTATYAGDSNFNGSTSGGEPHTVNKPATTTAITLDNPDPSLVGQPVPVQYSVTSAASGTPTGNVTVSDGTVSCTGTVAAGQCSITFTSAGAKSLTATYAGDTNFQGSTSAAEPHTVLAADTTASITSDNPDPSVVGQSVQVKYSVSPVAPGAGTATGNVTVSDGTVSCTGTVAAGQCSITFTSAGAKTLTATYAGDSNFNGSTSAAEAHTVNKADTTTSITSDNPDPSIVGQAVLVQYSVAAVAPGAGTPTGNVTVSDGTVSCTSTVAAGQCSITFTSAGAKTLTATYAGDSNFNGSTSAGEPHTVNGISTTTAILGEIPDPSVVGQSVTVEYSVTPGSGSGTPTGTVTITDGTVSCSGNAAGPTFGCALTFTSAGAKSLTATYSGDSNFQASTSAAVSHQVNPASTTTTITSDSPDPSVQGSPVTVKYNVAVISPGAGTPTGNVTVSDGVNSCTGSVSAGQCDITLTTVGARTLTATYAGDSNFNGSTSAGEPHTVNPPTVQITVDTNPTGLSITVDGTTYSAPQTFSWTPSSQHTIATTSPQGSGGTQYQFNNWSDSGAISHTVTVPSTATTYTASFDTYYQLKTSVNPSNGGSVAPASGTFYLKGSAVNLSATANTGFTFSSWTGNVADPSQANTTITMNQPESVTANFSASTSLLYNGGQIVVIGNSFTPAALLSSPASSCVSGKTINFYLDRNPTTGVVGNTLIASALTNSSGQATSVAVNTTGWLEGIYTITAKFNGTALCKPSSNDATLTVGSSGDAASGGGWYTLPGSGRINFGFVVMKTDKSCTANCTYKGQFLLMNNSKWQLKGTLNNYVKLSTGTGASSGTGTLNWWNSSLNGGLGGWALAANGVSFTINFFDSGTSGKLSTDTFGINIQYTPVPPQPSTLPNSAPQLLKGGNIIVK